MAINNFDPGIMAAIISGIGVIVVAVIGYLGQRKGSLSNAEHNFRQTVVEENNRLRDRIDELEGENQELHRRILKLEGIMIRAGLVIYDDEEA